MRDSDAATLATLVPDARFPNLWRVRWPDGALSIPANLTRARDAARSWAETQMRRDLRKNGADRALKSLANFSWRARRARPNDLALTDQPRIDFNAPTASAAGGVA